MENKTINVTKAALPPYEEYIEAIKPLWDSHWITNMGTYHKTLEKELQAYLDVPELSLMVNGHLSLEMAIQSFGFPEGSEVITTPFTFISTTHAIVRNRLTPVFCDVKESDGTIDESKIEELITEKTVAIVPVHVYGHICNIEAIEEIAYKYGLKVIYDACHAFGIRYKGKGIGSYGDASVFSFHATKVYNTIEGGAVCCHDHRIYEKLYNLKNFGIRGEELVSDVGANAKMNEFCAIMGLCNLKHIDENLSNREKIYAHYTERLKSIDGLKKFESNNIEATNNHAYLPVLIADGKRNAVYDALNKEDIHARKYFYPLTSDQACFKNKYRKCPLETARRLADSVLTLPLSAELPFEDIDRITEIIEVAL